jgi:hypothetical protein
MLELQQEAEQCKAALEICRRQQQVDEMRLSILETLIHHITKPESRDHLAQSIAGEIVQRWQANFEKRLPA